MFCTACGSKNEYHAAFCPQCGEPPTGSADAPSNRKAANPASLNKSRAWDQRPFEPLIDSKVAAKYLGFSPLSVRRMAHAKRIPAIAFPIGNSGKNLYRFRLSELEAFVKTLERSPAQNENRKQKIQ